MIFSVTITFGSSPENIDDYTVMSSHAELHDGLRRGSDCIATNPVSCRQLYPNFVTKENGEGLSLPLRPIRQLRRVFAMQCQI